MHFLSKCHGNQNGFFNEWSKLMLLIGCLLFLPCCLFLGQTGPNEHRISQETFSHQRKSSHANEADIHSIHTKTIPLSSYVFLKNGFAQNAELGHEQCDTAAAKQQSNFKSLRSLTSPVPMANYFTEKSDLYSAAPFAPPSYIQQLQDLNEPNTKKADAILRFWQVSPLPLGSAMVVGLKTGHKVKVATGSYSEAYIGAIIGASLFEGINYGVIKILSNLILRKPLSPAAKALISTAISPLIEDLCVDKGSELYLAIFGGNQKSVPNTEQ